MQASHLEYRFDDSILTQRTLHLRTGAAGVQLATDGAGVQNSRGRAAVGSPLDSRLEIN